MTIHTNQSQDAVIDDANRAVGNLQTLIDRAAATQPRNASDERQDSSECYPAQATWKELFAPIVAKLKHSLAQHKSNAKTYIGSLVAVMVVAIIPWPHRVGCDVVCEPAVRRYVSAPFDATLLSSNVKAGQRVTAGQVLAVLDGGDLRAELAAKQAELLQAGQRQMAALASGDHSIAENERLEVEQLKQEIELLENRQEKLEIRSPIDGVVVTGDLERVAGAPLGVGDSLFEIASLEQLIAEVAVPESDITFVDDSMNVNIVLDAAPALAQKTKIQHVHLRSEIRDNASVFVAEAPMSNPDGLFRPGMSGTASVHAGYQPLGWILFHRPYDALRQSIGW